MRICGIVCEYNPFHNGHKYHIEQTKNCGIDGIVCVMSGDFVQRGEAALLSKYDRAEMALHGGADLVLELPSPYALSSAERFASGAISILASLGVVDSLSFGCEAKSLDILKQARDILNDAQFYQNIKERMKNGSSFAIVRDAVLKECAPNCADALRKPNNLLATEYLRALPDNITPIAIKRFGSDHDSSVTSDSIASASAIRSMILNDGVSAVKPYLPETSYEILNRAVSCGNAPVTLANHDRMLLSHLKRMSREDLCKLPDVSEGLDARLHRAISDAIYFSEIADLTKTKRYAHSRIRRILLCAFLNITREEAVKPPAFTRVLGCNDVGRTILALARKKTQIPIITKPASAKDCDAFKKEVVRSSLYTLLMPELKPRKSDWQRSPIIL